MYLIGGFIMWLMTTCLVYFIGGVIAFMAMLVVTLMDPSEAVAIYVCAPCYLAIYIFSYFYTKKKGVTAANIDV